MTLERDEWRAHVIRKGCQALAEMAETSAEQFTCDEAERIFVMLFEVLGEEAADMFMHVHAHGDNEPDDWHKPEGIGGWGYKQPVWT